MSFAGWLQRAYGPWAMYRIFGFTAILGMMILFLADILHKNFECKNRIKHEKDAFTIEKRTMFVYDELNDEKQMLCSKEDN